MAQNNMDKSSAKSANFERHNISWRLCWLVNPCDSVSVDTMFIYSICTMFSLHGKGVAPAARDMTCIYIYMLYFSAWYH